MFHRKGKPASCGFCILLLVAGFLTLNPVSASATRIGISGTGGLGIFVASEKEYYGDIQTDIYPEIGLDIDIMILKFGLKAGLIYRKYEMYGHYEYCYDFDCYYESFYEEYTMSYLPVQAEVLLLPLAMVKTDFPISPYIGFMGGAYIPVGDNDDTLPAFSFKIGAEFNIDPLIFYGDIRYTFARHELYGHDYDAGGVMIVMGGGLRFGTKE